MESWLLLLWFAVIVQRAFELRKAEENAIWMKKQGGYEVGKNHYPLILAVHALFFVGILLETVWLGAKPPLWWPIPLLLFMLTQGLRIWCIQSLGRYWNTRIWVVPGHSPQVGGPYRYLRHPNYLVVILEIALFSVVFGAYVTAGLVTLLNAFVLLFIRIPIEEKALSEAIEYKEVMEEKRRFLPTVTE